MAVLCGARPEILNLGKALCIQARMGRVIAL